MSHEISCLHATHLDNQGICGLICDADFETQIHLSTGGTAEASSTQDAQRDAKQMEPVCVNGGVHTARNIKGFSFEFGRARPVWIGPETLRRIF